MVRRLLGVLLLVAGSALAVWLSTLIDYLGITVTATTTGGEVGTVVAVALIFGVVNLVVKPIAKFIGFPLYFLTLGLIALVVNGLLLMLTDWIAGLLDIPFAVESFWPGGVLGALFIGIASWGLNKVSDVITSIGANGGRPRAPAPRPVG